LRGKKIREKRDFIGLKSATSESADDFIVFEKTKEDVKLT
jgi:hypothetical protein